MTQILSTATFLFGFALISGAARADSHEFFKGKTIRLVVENSAGGAMDDWGAASR